MCNSIAVMYVKNSGGIVGGGGINKINSLSFIFDIYFCYLNFNYLIPNVDWQTDFLIYRCWTISISS